jgi:DNA-binding NtrC family response regulator
MGPDLSHATLSARFPRILIAENHFSTVESLIQTFGDRRLDLDFDVCTSHRSAVRKLLASPYQVIISGVHLAELDDFLLLKRIQALEASVPLVITATTADKESARRVLEQGAFDLIPTPLEHEQTVDSIRLALWYNKFKALIASRDKALERYQQYIANYPGNRRGDAFRTILT